MSTTGENILKSLAVLEQNLKDIDSAKLQVSKVVKSSDDLAKVFETYQSSFDGVSKNLKTVLSEIKSINLDTISNLSKQTELFNKEVDKLSNLDFETSFNSAKKEIVKQFEKDLKEKLTVLEDKTTNFDKEVTRLTEFDFTNSFDSIEAKVIDQFEKDFKEQLLAIDKQSKNLQDKIDEFKSQISRLEAIDLESHFSALINDLTKQNNEVKFQNETLLKETKTNRTLLIFGVIIIVGLVIVDIILK